MPAINNKGESAKVRAVPKIVQREKFHPRTQIIQISEM